MKHQRGKVSKPRGLVQRREQADKEVKSWSPSQANSDLLFLFSTTYLSPSYKQNHFPFYKHVKREKEKKNSTINSTRKNMLKQKQKENTNTNTKVKKKDAITVFYHITSSIKHQQERGKRGQRIAISEVRGLYIYIYTLSTSEKYVKLCLRTLGNRKTWPIPCSLFPVCLFVCRHSADIYVSAETACRKTLLGTYLVGWYLTVGKGKGKDFLFCFFLEEGIYANSKLLLRVDY